MTTMVMGWQQPQRHRVFWLAGSPKLLPKMASESMGLKCTLVPEGSTSLAWSALAVGEIYNRQ